MNLYEELVNYAKSDFYPFHMPGHKRRKFSDMQSPYEIDITEIEGFDNLHEPENVLARDMKEAAQIYHTLSTHFLVNGSTSGLLAAIFAVTKQGDSILMARNCHKAVYNAVLLRELIPSYLYPTLTRECKIAKSIDANEVEQEFLRKKEIAAVVITSPTYDGVVSDIQAIAAVVHAYGSVLIVDEAHGAHFPFHEDFPRSAIDCGADIVIQSIHKTLPSLTQTALLHRNSERVEIKHLQKYLSIFQSSSPSYVLLSSIERCIEFAASSKVAFEGYLKMLDDFYANSKDLKHLCLWEPLEGSNIFRKDKSKLIIYANNGEVSGTWIYENLLNTYHIQAEMVMKDYVVCLSSVCDTKEGFERLLEALHELDRQVPTFINHDSTKKEAYLSFYDEKILSNEQAVLLSKVEEQKCVTKPLIECEGEIAAEYIYLYPPGIPIVVPGERVSKALIEQLREYQSVGLSLRGMADHTGVFLDVLIREKN